MIYHKNGIAYDIKVIVVKAEPRYLDDYGSDDIEVTKFPCMLDDNAINLIINTDTGAILNWNGPDSLITTSFKVCDQCEVSLFDRDDELIMYHQGYVPKMLDFSGDSYGDYLFFKIKNGVLINFKHIDYLDKFTLLK